MPIFRRALALLAFVFVVAGCDTSNPGTNLAEVQGVYTFSELRFEPVATGLAPANVLARLDPERTSVEIFGDGNALLRYTLVGQTSSLAFASARATAAGVTITARAQDDAAKFGTLLLPATLTLSRTPGDDRTLSRSFFRSNANPVNLEAFDAEVYRGQTRVSGTLYVTLRRERR
ncbi:MAG: hypothetical protein ACK41D_01170 [Rubricoccaceae bacterium]